MGPIRRAVQALILSAWLASAAAAKPASDPVPLPALRESGIFERERWLGETCVAGENRPGIYAVDYVLPPNDQYFTFLDFDPCTCGPGTERVITVAVTALLWDVACSQEIAVSIVGATGSAPCYVPDPTNVICPEVSQTLAPGTGSFLHFLAVAESCKPQGPVFLCINFPVVGPTCTETSMPNLGAAGTPCAQCRTYNYYPGTQDELCAAPRWPGVVGNPVMYVESICSPMTPTLPLTWGGLKVLYR